MLPPDPVPLYIGGVRRNAESGATFDTLNPATNALLRRVQRACEADVDAAVDAAQRAQTAWAATAPVERGRILRRAARILRDRRDEIARVETLDTGRPIAETPEADVDSAADCLEFFGGIAAGVRGEHIDLGGPFAYTKREPLGVCGGIGAWNYPIQIAAWKSAPALACGNAMVFKPAELTPLTACVLHDVLAEAGLPEGLFNVVHGFGDTGQMLTRHPGIAKVSLTGEVGTGKKVMADAAETLKVVTMELGGKSPLIVFDDAHLDNAVGGAMLGNFFSQGEICSNGTRVFVHADVLEDFLDRLCARTERMRLGDPLDPETDVGPLISREHMERVLGFIDSGTREGARLLMGGERAQAGALADGNYVQPTIFVDASDDMTIVREEIFGPVMTVLPFRDEAEVVERANATPYGLAAGVFTNDLTRAHRVVGKLDAGTCWVNAYNLTPIEMPFGPVKQSGFGRENGWAAIEAYTRLKSVYVEMGDVESPY